MEAPTDPLDLATEAAEAFTNAAIEQARRSSGPRLEPNGLCRNCHDPVEDGQLFCDEYCAEDFEYVRQRRQANRHVT